MLKKKLSVLRILVMMLALILVLAGCATTGDNGNETTGGSEPNKEPKTIIVIGFNLESRTPVKGVIIDPDWDNWKEYASGGIEPGNNYKDGTITLYLWADDGSGRFTGTGEFSLLLSVEPGREVGKPGSTYVLNRNVEINEAETTVNWSDFEFGWDW